MYNHKSAQTPRQRLNDTFNKAFKILYPYANTSYELALLAYNVAYIFNNTDYYRPWLQLMGIEMQRLSPAELQSKPTPPTALAARLPHLFFESLRYVLPGSIFLFKFLEWWYSSSLRPSARSLSSAEVPPPVRPPPSKSSPLPGTDPPKKGQCPVCKNEIVNATALTSSGWVCCYKCAWSYVEQWGKCPVSGIVTATADLRKIVG